MKTNRAQAFLTFALCMVTACGGGQDFGEEEEEEEEEELGSSSDAIQNTNALNPNALNPNALNPNALNPNALDLNGLNLNALNPNSLSADDLNAIQDPGTRGTISRELLKYTVGCAMDTSQAFEFTWTDTLQVAHPERYTGLLGLAPEWYDNPLSNAKGRWISACLASRVNWYGAAVMISSRGSHQQLKHVDAVEHSTYPAFEGAFFGDAFASSPVYYACYDPTNVTHSRSLLRECASGHPNGTGGILECGPIHVLGPCENYCTSWNATEGFYEQCRASSGSPWYGEVVSTFLP